MNHSDHYASLVYINKTSDLSLTIKAPTVRRVFVASCKDTMNLIKLRIYLKFVHL